MSPEPESLDAAGIASRSFATSRRGFDPGEVRAYLQTLSEAVGKMHRREVELQARVEQVETRVEQAEQLDEGRLVELLGEETTRVLAGARTAAVDIKQKAQEAASRLISEANDEAHRLRAEGERTVAAQRNEMMAEVDALRREVAGELDRRRAEADDIVTQMRREAETECDAMRRSGEQARADAVGDAEALRAEAQEEGRQMVAEAQLVREKILHDLSRRRRSAREQLERLHAARDRLIAAYEVVRRTVAEATTELNVALPEAKIAGDQAMRRVQDEPEPTTDELEAQVATARIAGLIGPLSESLFEIETEKLPEPAQRSQFQEDAVEDDEPAASMILEPDGGEAVSESVNAARGFEGAVSDPSEAASTGADNGEYSDDDRVPQPVAVAAETAGHDTPDLDALFARLRVEQDHESDESDGPGEDRDYESEDGSDRGDGPEYDSEVSDGAGDEPRDESAPETTEVAAEILTKVVLDSLSAPGEEEVAEADDDASEADDAPGADHEHDLLQQRDEALVNVESGLSRRLKRALADEQNEMLDLLRRTKPASAEELLPSIAEHTAHYADAARGDLETAVGWGAAHVADGASEAEGTCDALVAELGQTVVEPLRERITRCFADTEGDLTEVTGRLRALYREWKGQRIADAVRHYTAAAYALGAYGAVPDGTRLCWLVDRGGDPCPDADDNALARAVGKGDAFPTGDHCPPAHLGCRCLVVPEVRLR